MGRQTTLTPDPPDSEPTGPGTILLLHMWGSARWHINVILEVGIGNTVFVAMWIMPLARGMIHITSGGITRVVAALEGKSLLLGNGRMFAQFLGNLGFTNEWAWYSSIRSIMFAKNSKPNFLPKATDGTGKIRILWHMRWLGTISETPVCKTTLDSRCLILFAWLHSWYVWDFGILCHKSWSP